MNDIELATDLAECEQVIERGLATFVDVGRALLRIRDERLYRQEHASFEAYCQQRWSFNRHRAAQLIGAVDVVTNVTSAGLPAPANEGQARELARVPELERAEVWREAHDRTAGKPTAAVVREIREERAAPANDWPLPVQAEPEPEQDFADPVPPEIDAEFRRRAEARRQRAEAEADGARFAAELSAKTTPETQAWADEQRRRIRAVLHVAESCEELLRSVSDPAEVIDQAPEHLRPRLNVVPAAADYLTRFRKELEARG